MFSTRVLVPLALLGLLSSSLTALRQAPARVDASAEAIRLNNLGVAAMNQQKPEVALERFQAAAKADPSLAAARLNQAIAMTGLQQYEPAQQILDALVESEPGNVRAWYNLGLLLRTLGESEKATGRLHAHDGAGARATRTRTTSRDCSPASCSSRIRRSDRSRARSNSIPSSSRPSSASPAPTSAAERPTTPSGTWTGSRG